jgi:hypothetical protein
MKKELREEIRKNIIESDLERKVKIREFILAGSLILNFILILNLFVPTSWDTNLVEANNTLISDQAPREEVIEPKHNTFFISDDETIVYYLNNTYFSLNSLFVGENSITGFTIKTKNEIICLSYEFGSMFSKANEITPTPDGLTKINLKNKCFIKNDLIDDFRIELKTFEDTGQTIYVQGFENE